MLLRMFAVPMTVICAMMAFAQDPTATKPAAPATAPEGEKPAPGDTVAPVVENPIVETVAPLVAKAGETLPTAEQIVAKGLAFMHADRLAAAKSLEFQRLSLIWRNKRLVLPERYRTQARVQWPPVARVTETHYPQKGKPVEMLFIQNGTDAFQQDGLNVLSEGVNEVATKLRVGAELSTPLLLSWIAEVKAPLVLDGRATVQTFVPKTFKPIEADDKKDEGFFDYEPVTKTYLQVTAEMPKAMADLFGPAVVLFFDEADGHLARLRYEPRCRRELYSNITMNFEIEQYGDVLGPDGKPTGAKIPTLLYLTLEGSADRQETLRINQPTIDRNIKDDLFHRP